MSTFEPKHDNALLAVSWLSKPTDDGRWLFKYAPHPDRAGYVFIATNLEIVLFESLTAPSIPSRLQALSSQSQSQSQATSSQRKEVDIVRQAEKVLKKLNKEIMCPGRGWTEADVQVQEHAFFDRTVNVTSGTFEWVFNMTELKSPLPLTFISTHLVGPLASILYSRNSPSPSTSRSAIDLLGEVFDDVKTAEQLSAQTKSAKPALKRVIRTIPEEPDVGEESSVTVRSRSQSRILETPMEEEDGMNLDNKKTKEKEIDDEDVEEEYKSPEPSPLPTRSHRSGRSKVAVQAEDEGAPDTPDEEEEEYKSSPHPATASAQSPDRLSAPLAHAVSQGSTIPRKENASPSPKKPKAEQSRARTRTLSPPGPTPTQTSQRTKREREREEEEAMEKRMQEMKRKMGSGRGGRLGRRRAG